MLMVKAAYGLVQAPLQWYKSVCSFLQQLGCRRLKTEPCCWVFSQDGQVKSAIHAHVDDFLIAGRPGCPIHKELVDKVTQKFKWGTWETKDFIQCGIRMVQQDDFSIEIDQETFISEIEEIALTRDRSRQTESPTTDEEKKQLRAALGSMSWVCGQTAF